MIVWKAIERRHYERAKSIEDKKSRLAYILRLIEKWGFKDKSGQPIPVGSKISIVQARKVIREFEAFFND